MWFNSNTDKTIHDNHNVYGYLDGNQVISAFQNFSSGTNGTPENNVYSTHHPTPSPIYLAQNELYRFTRSIEPLSGRLSSSSLSGANVFYKCP